MLMPSIMKALNDRAGVIRQIALYGMFSGLAAGVNIGSRYLFSTGGLGFTWSVILAYGLGMIVNFLLNRYYNFPRGPRAAVHEMRTFLVIAGFGLVITTVVSNLLIPVAHALPGAWATGDFARQPAAATTARPATAITAAVDFRAVLPFNSLLKPLEYRDGSRVAPSWRYRRRSHAPRDDKPELVSGACLRCLEFETPGSIAKARRLAHQTGPINLSPELGEVGTAVHTPVNIAGSGKLDPQSATGRSGQSDLHAARRREFRLETGRERQAETQGSKMTLEAVVNLDSPRVQAEDASMDRVRRRPARAARSGAAARLD